MGLTLFLLSLLLWVVDLNLLHCVPPRLHCVGFSILRLKFIAFCYFWVGFADLNAILKERLKLTLGWCCAELIATVVSFDFELELLSFSVNRLHGLVLDFSITLRSFLGS